jgi:glutathione synthase/RimK-type ligase-like ATP-grasp enzyme
VDPHQQAIRGAARRLGVDVSELEWRDDVRRLEHGGRLVELRDGRRPSSLSHRVEALCDDKVACKARLASLGIPVPAGILVARDTPNQAAVAMRLARGRPQVLKPIAGTHGEHLRRGIRSLEEVLEHVAVTPREHRALVLEDEIEGHDLRIQAVGGSLVAACTREPGGAVDVTDLIHPRYADWVVRIAQAFPIELFAMDVRTPSLDADPERAARVLELNARPEWLHHTTSARRTHDIAAIILESLFGPLETDSRLDPSGRAGISRRC